MTLSIAASVVVTLLTLLGHSNSFLHPNVIQGSGLSTSNEGNGNCQRNRSFDSPSYRDLNTVQYVNIFGMMTKTRTSSRSKEKKSKDKPTRRINSVEELNQVFDEAESENPAGSNNDKLLKSIHVIGDTQNIGSPDSPEIIHPAVKILHERRRRNSQISSVSPRHDDGFKVALSIEGGGMRGCVSAGMVGAINYLGLDDAVDVVYGSSAGALIGAYFITKQLPWFGPEVYYDALPTAGRRFINTRRLLRAIGMGLLDPRLIRDVVFRPSNGKPVLDLSYLLRRTVQEKKPLNWEAFKEIQKNGQPLKIVTSGLKSEKSIVFDMESGSFETLEQCADCMHASMLLPGIAGPIMNAVWKENGPVDLFLENNHKKQIVEPLADALVFEPIPYRSALADGCTHVVVLRTRPDGTDVTGKSSIFEKLIMRRFFKRKNQLPKIYQYMRKQYHKKLYAEDVLFLNKKALETERDMNDISSPHIATVALPPGSEEITRLETERQAIFEGVRRGFARAYDALVEDPAERGRGAIVAKTYFPDEIMDYNPDDIDSKDESAFATYLSQLAAEKSIKNYGDKSWGKRAREINAPQ